MEHQKPSTALFDVYLRLRPSSATDKERFLDVEQAEADAPTHITIKPPANDNRKRAIEKFAFTRVFEEHAGQRELFESTGILPLVEGVLGAPGREGRDGLLATLGVTGSGKSHTILGSKSQRGLTQLTLDVLFQHTAPHLVDIDTSPTVYPSLCAADVSEAQLLTASHFLESIYSDCGPSRGATPALESSFLSAPPSRRYMPRVSTLPQYPPVHDIPITIDTHADYAIVISMYEVYNDRIFDLLTNPTTTTKTPPKRRALLFKSTESSPDRKVVAGLRKIICSTLDDALLVLETGLTERRVAGTGSNAVSSRSHGFFCVEVKKRHRGSDGSNSIPGPWTSSTLTIVDLAGSERARTAKTAGATLAEAGKINESLMYLGQCMQMQSDNASSQSPNLVPFRQCKLTELLFSNSFAHSNNIHGHSAKAPQKAIMIVTADPLGDFNATSQILRYSALAREVTVPRIPSVTASMQIASVKSASATAVSHDEGSSSSAALAEELEHALAEVSRLREQLELTQILLAEETQRRQDAEESWRVAEGRVEDVEAEVREEVWAEMEAKLALEQRRWRVAREEEMERVEGHLDRKVEVLVAGLDAAAGVWEDEKENVGGAGGDGGKVAELEGENERLRERVALMEREKGLRSPSKKMRVLKTRKWDGSGMGVDEIP